MNGEEVKKMNIQKRIWFLYGLFSSFVMALVTAFSSTVTVVKAASAEVAESVIRASALVTPTYDELLSTGTTTFFNFGWDSIVWAVAILVLLAMILAMVMRKAR